MCVRLIAFGEQMLADDIATNVSLARHGADIIESTCSSSSSSRRLKMLTHCNTGSLATAGHGTALGLYQIQELSRTLNQLQHTTTLITKLNVKLYLEEYVELTKTQT